MTRPPEGWRRGCWSASAGERTPWRGRPPPRGGGADALALLATTCWVGTRMGLETEAVIIDHGLQEGSAQIAERARTQAEQVGTTAHVIGVQVPSTAPGGVENAARAARHEALD